MKKFFAIILVSIIVLLITAGNVWAKCKCECQDTQKTTTEEDSLANCKALCDGLGVGNNGCPTIQDPQNKNAANQQSASLVNPIGPSSVSGVIGKIIQIFLGIIGTISLIMFIYGGFLMLTSAGRAGQIKTGQQTLVWASIGILVVFTSYAILKFVFSAFGI